MSRSTGRSPTNLQGICQLPGLQTTTRRRLYHLAPQQPKKTQQQVGGFNSVSKTCWANRIIFCKGSRNDGLWKMHQKGFKYGSVTLKEAGPQSCPPPQTSCACDSAAVSCWSRKRIPNRKNHHCCILMFDPTVLGFIHPSTLVKIALAKSLWPSGKF